MSPAVNSRPERCRGCNGLFGPGLLDFETLLCVRCHRSAIHRAAVELLKEARTQRPDSVPEGKRE